MPAMNEYGMLLEPNGYVQSIVQDSDAVCYLCSCGGDVARHEIFFGTAYRQKSKRYGLWVCLCPACHANAHDDRETRESLSRQAQEAAMERFGWTVQDFRDRFGKNWIQE